MEADRFICPILHEMMTDPVYAQDGILYSLAAIDRWVAEHGKSPLTREPIARTYFRPPELAAAYNTYCRSQGLPDPDLQPLTVRLPSTHRPSSPDSDGPTFIHAIIGPRLLLPSMVGESAILHAVLQTYINAMHPTTDDPPSDNDDSFDTTE